MKKITLPPIGMRLVKTAVALFVTMVITYLRPGGVPIFGALSAVLCMQSTGSDSLSIGINRIISTVVGAVFGLLTLLAMQPFALFDFWLWRYLLIGIVTVLVLYVQVLIKRPAGSYFAWVVFLSVVLLEPGMDPTLYAINRAADTFIGIGVSYLINGFWFSRKSDTAVLYVAAFDRVLAQDNGTLSNYTLMNLNRLLERKAAITIASHRTLATLLPRIQDVNFHLPVIIMDGAAIYNIEERSFPFYVALPADVARGAARAGATAEVQSYQYAILHDELHVFCALPGSAYEQVLDERLQLRRYHSYVLGLPPENADVLFLFFAGTHKQIDAVEAKLRALPWQDEIRIVRHDDDEHPGYANMEVTNPRASKDQAVRWLMQRYDYKKLVAFGRSPTDKALLQMADIAYSTANATPEIELLGLPVAGSNAHNAVVRKIRQLYYNRRLFRGKGEQAPQVTRGKKTDDQ